jgi:hypothetical protein
LYCINFNRINSKLKAGALLYAVFISFIIGLVCFFVILSHEYSRRNAETLILKSKLSDHVMSGIQILLTNDELASDNGETEYDLFEEEPSTVIFHKKRWGAYSVYTVEAQHNHLTEKRAVLVGKNVFKDEPVGLYVTDQNNYISFSGNTKVTGTCFAPNGTVKRAYIEGEHFRGDKLVHGDIQNSQSKLPDLDNAFLSNTESILLDPVNYPDTAIHYDEAFGDSDSLIRSFFAPTFDVWADENITIQYITASGNIRFFCNGHVTVSPSARLSNVIIYALSLHIQRGFKGNIQAYAFDSLTVEEDCQIGLPGFLGVISNRPASMEIHSHATISGGIMFYNTNITEQEKSQLYIHENANVYGEVYSNCYVQHKGTINGSLYAYKLFLETKMGKYENHLLDASVDFMNLPNNYTATCMFAQNNPKRIIEWVY